MKRWLKRIAFALAVILLLLSILNASWIAGKPGDARHAVILGEKWL